MSDPTDSLHYDSSSFGAHRSRVAQDIEVVPPQTYALPGALTPIHRDRLEAHQDDGLEMREIVEYENRRHIEAHPEIAERFSQWTNVYGAMVAVEREIMAEKRRKEAEASAEYQRRVQEMLARREES